MQCDCKDDLTMRLKWTISKPDSIPSWSGSEKERSLPKCRHDDVGEGTIRYKRDGLNKGLIGLNWREKTIDQLTDN